MDRSRIGSFCASAALFSIMALLPAVTFSSALTQIFMWAGFGLLAVSLVLERKAPVLPYEPALLALGLFFGAVIVSIFISEHYKQSFRGMLKVLRVILLLGAVLNVMRFPGAQNKFKYVFLATLLLVAANGFFQYWHGTDFLRGFAAQEASSGRRVSASFETYGKLAAFLGMAIPIAFAYAVNALKGKHFRELALWSVAVAGNLALLYLTRSRGGILAFVLAMTVILFLRRKWLILFLGLLLAGLVVLNMPRSMIIHLDSQNKEQSIVERLELWHRAWDVIQERPLTGTGINTYAVAHQKYDTRKNWRVQNYYAHNGYLQTAAEIGVPGTLGVIFFFIYWFFLNKPGSRNTDGENEEIRWGIAGGYLAFLIFCLADTAMHSLQPVILFWYFAGLFGAFNPAFSRR